ncbi:hypothetical protein GI374_11680 [Paracoccus sp. S-4012]|uniref:type II toxin-antitoxin system RelE/ParE family toxin n=1 Tax=Paracoccus sp. S-4012 TaxID=2665648 RepID=UPI0012AF304B|nr:type II toxin-antitoxin system RelE/ParE family toxin [Paracoccus sp. S-4012]MRX51094.1 hypothetical protein [Paracoccus sp. S-4012]
MKIVRTRRYLKDLKRIRATEAKVAALHASIVANPAAGDVVIGLKGVRKIRFPLGNKGKSGGGRAVYLLMIGDDVAVMLKAYAKNEQADLSADDCKAIFSAIKEMTDD